MKELFRRCGLNPQKSLLARVIQHTDFKAEGFPVITIPADQRVASDRGINKYHLILNGTLQSNNRTFSKEDLIIEKTNLTKAKAVTDTILMGLDPEAATQFIEDFKNLKKEINEILRELVKIPDLEDIQQVRIIRPKEFQRVYVEGRRDQYIYILLEGIVCLSRSIEYQEVCKYIETYVNTNFKFALLGEENIYNLPYQFTLKADSKLCYLVQIKTKSLCKRLTVKSYLDMKFQYQKRTKAVFQIGEEIQNFNNQNTPKKIENNKAEISLRGLCQKSKQLKGSITLRSFKPRDDLSYLQSRQFSHEKDQQKIDYFFDDRKQRVRFELIAKGLVTVEHPNYLKALESSGNFTQRLNNRPSKRKTEIGKEYLLPIMKRIALRRRNKSKQN